MRTGSPGHLKSFDYVGRYRYFLTFCTNRRIPRFTDPAVVDLVLSQISRAASEQAFAVIAYCFMPDHLHLLVEGRSEDADARRFIARAKQVLGIPVRQARRGRIVAAIRVRARAAR